MKQRTGVVALGLASLAITTGHVQAHAARARRESYFSAVKWNTRWVRVIETDLVPKMPPIAGRSPSYLARQLYDFQQGTRNGASAPLMRLVVANLTEEHIVAITAYAASLGTP